MVGERIGKVFFSLAAGDGLFCGGRWVCGEKRKECSPKRTLPVAHDSNMCKRKANAPNSFTRTVVKNFTTTYSVGQTIWKNEN